MIKGALKVGLAEPIEDDDPNIADIPMSADVSFEYLSDKDPKVLEIPPGVFHGYKALIPGTILMYYITEKYETVSKHDDQRVPIGHWGEDWSTPSK